MKNNQKKVALFMLSLLTHGGGAEKYFIALARNLRQRGMKADVITMDEKFYAKFARWLHIFFSLNFFRKIDMGGEESAKSIQQNLGQAKWIKSHFKNLKKNLNRYDVVYAKNEIVDLILLKLIGYRHLPRIVVGVHTPLYYPRANSFAARLHNVCYRSFFYHWLLSGSGAIHVSNQFTKNFIEKKFKMPTQLIYYPFDIFGFKSGEKSGLEFDASKINLCFVGRLTEQKGLNVLRRLIRQIALDEKISAKIVLNIFARGDKRTEKEFEGFDKKYIWLKYFRHLENRFMADVLVRQDLMLAPSNWEVLPYNVLEAQAVGLPVIAFDIPGPAEIIVDGLSGELVKSELEFRQKTFDFIAGRLHYDKEVIARNIEIKFNFDEIYARMIELLIGKNL